MDQGVIWSLKLKYRILSVRRFITALENDEDVPSFSILDAMKMPDANRHNHDIHYFAEMLR